MEQDTKTGSGSPVNGHSPGKAIGNLLANLSVSLGTIFLIPSPWIGIIFWAALLLNPRFAAFALLGIVIGAGIGKVFRIGDMVRIGGGFKANAMLAALMVAWMTTTTGISLEAQLGMAAASAATAAILTSAIIRVLQYSRLPSLIWGYCIVAGLVFTVCPACVQKATAALQVEPIPADVPGWLMALLRSLGSFIYSPTYEAGLLVGLAILAWSRIMFFTGMVGWLSGVAIALAFEKLGVSYYWLPASYNYFIVGMALGSVFLLPGRTSLVITVLGGCTASFIGFVLQGTPVAYLPVPAVTTIWLILGTITLAGNKCLAWLNYNPLVRPEFAWWSTAYWSVRFGQGQPLLAIPMPGKLQITQGFNGKLSHKGNWQHALDFQRPEESGYDQASSIWGGIVYAPAPGIIERVVNSVPDNPAGVCNYADNWGNYVVIRLDQGGYALLAHFQQGSITVTTGTHVEAGDYIGRVGNSGRSPVPHLHMQAQSAPDPSSPTIPFRLVNYQSLSYPDKPLHHLNAAVPPEGTIVVAAIPNKPVHDTLTSMAPGTAVWTIEEEGRVPRHFQHARTGGTLRVNITLDEAGNHLFSIPGHGTLVSRLAPDAFRLLETRKISSPFLELMALAIPSLPYAGTVGMTWNDASPVKPIGFTSWPGLSVSPYVGTKPFIFSCMRCTAEPGYTGKVIEVETELGPRRSVLPEKLTCQLDFLRGPVRLEANFRNGTVVYKLLSFQPGLPLGEGAPDPA